MDIYQRIRDLREDNDFTQAEIIAIIVIGFVVKLGILGAISS